LKVFVNQSFLPANLRDASY